LAVTDKTEEEEASGLAVASNRCATRRAQHPSPKEKLMSESVDRRSALKTAAGALVAGPALLVAGEAFANQPHMTKAEEYIKMAVSELKQANANKGGHREKAIELCGEALDQIQKGIAAAS